MHQELIIKININPLQRARCRTRTHPGSAAAVAARGSHPETRRWSPLAPSPAPTTARPWVQSPWHHEVCFSISAAGLQAAHPVLRLVGVLPPQGGLGEAPRDPAGCCYGVRSQAMTPQGCCGAGRRPHPAPVSPAPTGACAAPSTRGWQTPRPPRDSQVPSQGARASTSRRRGGAPWAHCPAQPDALPLGTTANPVSSPFTAISCFSGIQEAGG